MDDKQLLYSLIYSLRLVELEMLKIYIKNNLASNYIKPFKSSANISILFILKKDGSLYLYIDYSRLNNLTIKNCYLLSLINKLLDFLDRTKYFTQLD